MDTRRGGIRVEICPWETFRAHCTEDKQIIIRSALYGRIDSARCFKGNLAVNGSNCSADVQSFVKGKCAKRNHCEIELPDMELDDLSACPKSQLQYLEIVYECRDS